MSKSAGRERLMLELRRSTGPAILFLVLILAGIATAVYIVKNLAGDKPWVSYAKYQVAFDNVKGVVPGRAELRIAGVKAGSITKSELVNGRAVLKLNVEKKYAPLHTNAKVVIRPVTALEDEYVDITSRGTADAPVLKSNQILPESRTKSQEEVGKILNTLEGDTRERLSSLLDALGAGTKDRGKKLRESFAQLGPFLETATKLGDALRERKTNTARLVHNLGNLTQVLQTRDQQIAGFVDNGGKLLGELAQHDGTLGSTIQQLPGTLSNLQATLNNVRGTTVPLERALVALRPAAKSLPTGLDSLSKFSNEATPPVKSLRPSVKAIKPLARELRRTSSNGQAALTPLVGQFTQLNHGTSLVKPCLPQAGALVNRVSSLLKYSGTDPTNYVPDARAIATVDFDGTLNNGGSEALKKFNYEKIIAPCFTDPSDSNARGGTLTPVPSRDAAVSQEQK